MSSAAGIRLAGETDFAGFRRHARELLRSGVRPEDVTWQTGADASLFGDETVASNPDVDLHASAHNQHAADAQDASPALTLARELIQLFAQAALHSDLQRYALLYRALWRLAHEANLRHDPLDADIMRIQRMAQAVRRDMHKMKAFVRFRTLQDGDDQPLHVAWFEPSHHVVEATAPFFARRFTAMRWAILTPRGSAHWEPGGALVFGPPARKEDAPPADAGEALWLTYYQHIFNPARLKMKMMQKEMPRKYWHNLPEAALIAPLAARAEVRSEAMVAQPASAAERVVRFLPPRPAYEAPASIESLEQLRAATQRCRECPIGEHATQSVCGEGPLRPRIMFVGEQPGDQEDLHGRPFVGPAGQLFDRALARIGVARDTVYIANAVKHFKFELRGKRRIHKTPGQREAAACRHWLDDEIRLVQPQVLVALGATGARALLGAQVSVTRDRGQWFDGEHGLPVLVTLHPAALLRAEPGLQADGFEAWVKDLASAINPPSSQRR